MSLTWLERDELTPTVSKKILPADILLDIGCGIRPQPFVIPKVHICCEPFGPYIEHLQNLIEKDKTRHYVVINATWSQIVSLFPPKSVDSVFLLDVIEHLEKEEAIHLLKLTEQITRIQIVVFTPLGFLPQKHPDGKDAWGFDGGLWQEHRSGWEPDDFDTTWDLYGAKVYHFVDNMGRALEKPYGALWAVKSFQCP
ncbi:MAG: class I SAM-dependent methyltransferase [Bacillota bacterium]